MNQNHIPQTLIEKYNIPVPRYTSYPPANYFTPEFTATDYREQIVASNSQSPSLLSFYFHIPFCRRLCHYCGCNAYPMASAEYIDRYVESLHREMDIVLPLIDRNRKISQIHYGGGTPTILPIEKLKELNQHLLEYFPQIEQPEIAIECHPGWLNETYWQGLADAGFNRVSLGIQDFQTEVLKCVNRKPSLLPVADIVSLLRERGIRINMDFLYGLPLQTPASFEDTIRKAIDIRPDRLVTFSYAHVPWVNKRQLILEKAGLPDASLKEELFRTAQELLLQAGYLQIGMDHFVCAHDELALARQNHSLHRNFQGYCTRRTTGQVYAFGVTGISQLSTAYAQNTKDLDAYLEAVNQGHLPVIKGYKLNEQEQIVRRVIDTLMCNNLIDWQELSDELQLSIEKIKYLCGYDAGQLEDMVRDGLVDLSENRLEVTPLGKAFVRNVASTFDQLTRNNPKSFSKPI